MLHEGGGVLFVELVLSGAGQGDIDLDTMFPDRLPDILPYHAERLVFIGVFLDTAAPDILQLENEVQFLGVDPLFIHDRRG